MIGRVWPFGNPHQFITLQNPYYSSRRLVVTGPAPAGQHWAIIQNGDLQRRGQFIVVSYPDLRYIVRVRVQRRYTFWYRYTTTYILQVETIPYYLRFAHGGIFHSRYLSTDYLFRTVNRYRYGRFVGQHIQNVRSSRVLSYSSSGALSLAYLSSYSSQQLWGYHGQ